MSTEKITLQDFLGEYGESIADKVMQDLPVVHNPEKDSDKKIVEVINTIEKRPFQAQSEIIKACYKSFICGNKAVYLIAEMGTGKTLMGLSVGYVLHKLKRIKRIIILCPPTLVLKWIQEIKDALPYAKTYNLNGKDVITQLETIRKQPKPHTLEFYIVGRERVKTGYMWKPAVVEKNSRYYCPKCGQELIDKNDNKLYIFAKGKYKKKFSCKNTITKYIYNNESKKHTKKDVPCGEQLWQADSGKKAYRKIMPAKFIKDKMKGCFDFLICDEFHQYKNESGQGYALSCLISSVKYTLCLTGTLAGGYPEDVFRLLFRTHPKLMIDHSHNWSKADSFIKRYGVLEKVTSVEKGDDTKQKKRTKIIKKPGISPLLLGEMLLSQSVFLRLDDCAKKLVPYDEHLKLLELTPDMQFIHSNFENKLKQALIEALKKKDNSLLGSYINSLLRQPERFFEGIEVIHPRTQEVVAYAPPIHDLVSPKEIELITIIKQELCNMRKVLVFVESTGITDITLRLVTLLEEQNIKAKVLRSTNTEGRVKIISKWVKEGIDVLITNPKKVEVGLDLLDFPSIIFYQIPLSTYTLRQASRRSWRLPQTKPVKVYFMAYKKTIQTKLMKLMADKLTSSLALEGKLTDEGLSALSETTDSMTIELAKILVEKTEDSMELQDIWANYSEKATNNSSIEEEKKEEQTVVVSLVEYSGKRKKKVKKVSVKQSNLDDFINKTQKDKNVSVQLSLF